jgi:hypothetical protein
MSARTTGTCDVARFERTNIPSPDAPLGDGIGRSATHATKKLLPFEFDDIP